jgi:hypothetical protein
MSDHVLNIGADAEDRKETMRGGGRNNTFAKDIKVFTPNPLLTQKGRMEFELGEIPGTAINREMWFGDILHAMHLVLGHY